MMINSGRDNMVYMFPRGSSERKNNILKERETEQEDILSVYEDKTKVSEKFWRWRQCIHLTSRCPTDS